MKILDLMRSGFTEWKSSTQRDTRYRRSNASQDRDGSSCNKSNPNFSLNLSEADTKKHSYTYHTMRHFNEIYPNDEFYFILGADSLFAFEEWKDFRKIFTTCTILAAMRDDKDASSNEGTDTISHGSIRSAYRTASRTVGRDFLYYNKRKGSKGTQRALYGA